MLSPQLAVSTPPLPSPVCWRWSGLWRLWRWCAAQSASTYGRLVRVPVSPVEVRGDAQDEPAEPTALRRDPMTRSDSIISYARRNPLTGQFAVTLPKVLIFATHSERQDVARCC